VVFGGLFSRVNWWVCVKTLLGGIRGFDDGKKLARRKRHILADTQGFLLAVVVHAANIPDRQGGRQVLQVMGSAFPRMQRIWADQGYTGSLIPWIGHEHRLREQLAAMAQTIPISQQTDRSAHPALDLPVL
jgi:hypothetical protein